MCQNPSYLYAEDINGARSLLLKGLHFERDGTENKQTNKNTRGDKYDREN